MKKIVSEFDVVIKVKPELPLIRTVEAAARSYLKVQAFPPRLVDHTIAAIGEAMERLIALCIERDVAATFDVGFLSQDEAVQVHLVYGASIPLNPHEEADYEVPSSTGEETGSELEGLWLHIIKRTMDRVFFRVDGKRASLVMMKYIRAEQKARQLWVMGLRPKLRVDLVIEHPTGEMGQTQSGSAILHGTRGQLVLKLSPSDVFIVSRFNGQNTVEDIYLEHSAELGPVSPQQVQRLYETLEASGMLERIASAAEERKERWQRWLSPVISIPHPDNAVAWVHRHGRFLFNPIAVSAMVLIGLSGLIPLFMNRQPMGALIANLDTLLISHPTVIALAYLIMLGNVAIHEFAHGVTCKHFGGRIRQLGIMWYLAMFIFFCDTTSAWTFPKKSQRIWVSLAGPLASWTLFGITAWCVGVTAAAASPWFILWIVLTMINAFGLVMNFNPLIRGDAYYILVDWTGIPNLQKKALDYLKVRMTGWMKRGRAVGRPSPTPRERRIFVTYGVLSAAMSFFFLLLPFWRLADLWLTNRHFTTWGVMAFITVALLIGNMLFKAHGLVYAARHQEHKIL
ncbi:MAG: metalloprotease family protein [Proteobacteria bacterium]|nr:metalloprotease family protein [Pseudomonadota bacterium]